MEISKETVKASSGDVCDIDNSCTGGEVVAFEQGLTQNNRPVAANRSNPEKALGMPGARRWF